MKFLSELKVGEQATIQDVLESPSKMKLMEMGCVPGQLVKVTLKSPLNGPIAIEVAGYVLSMRISDAANIVVS